MILHPKLGNDFADQLSMTEKSYDRTLGFVRISLERLRLSIKEFVNELPPEMDQAYTAAVSPEAANPPRLFIPTRPSLLKLGEYLRIFIIASGQEEVTQVKLHTRRQTAQEWHTSAATHA